MLPWELIARLRGPFFACRDRIGWGLRGWRSNAPRREEPNSWLIHRCPSRFPAKGKAGKSRVLAENWDGAVGLFRRASTNPYPWGRAVCCVCVFSILGITEDAARVFDTFVTLGQRSYCFAISCVLRANSLIFPPHGFLPSKKVFSGEITSTNTSRPGRTAHVRACLPYSNTHASDDDP